RGWMADWRKRIERFAHRVEEKIDTQREKLGLTGGRGRAPRIEAYRGYGSPDRAYLRGRVLRNPPIPAAASHDSKWLNLASMLQRFESDEVPHARVLVRAPGGDVEVTADEEGYFECWLHPDPPLSTSHLWHTIELELLHPREEGEPSGARASVLVPPPESAFGVISDLDDTVLRSDVTSTLRMMRTVFFENARTRMPYPGVAAFYRALEKGAGESPFNPIFYVSSSPWNFHDLLTEFLTVQKIPLGPLLLRDWGLSKEGVAPGGNRSHKLEAIRRLLGIFPALPFILIGDSGQEDPEIYAEVVAENPDRIRAVYIRNVTPRPERLEAIRALAGEVEAAGSALLLCDDTLGAARHAAANGWIAESALDEIGQVAHAEEKPAPGGTAEVNRELSTVPGDRRGA
ncbi:MAG TPA: phosphatase domain-containing protein, partial [Longimicrobium sp.]|nr:phosphatase domain-containing protein [Longimicrobium sp.]